MNIEIRERSFGYSRDWYYYRLFVIVADGRRVDSFLCRENAEKKVAKLRAEQASV